MDSGDPSRLPEAQKALKKVLSDERLQDIPLMVLANKNDLPNTLSIEKVQNLDPMTQLDLVQFNNSPEKYKTRSTYQHKQSKSSFVQIT